MLQTKWDLSPLFKDDNDPAMEESRKAIRAKTDAFVAKWKPRTDWLSDPKVLLEAIQEYEDWHKECAMGGDAGYYFFLRTSQDQNDPGLKGKAGKQEDFANGITTDMQFFVLMLSKVNAEVQDKFLEAAELAPWKHFLERCFAEGKHVLSEQEEKILVLKNAPAAANWERMVSGFTDREEREVVFEDGHTEKKTLEGLLSLTQHRNKNTRDSAAAGVNEILAKYADVAEHEINSLLLNKKIDDELRGFQRPDAERHLADDIDTAVVDILVSTVADRFDVANRFYAFQAKLLGVPKLAYHERGVAIGEVEQSYSFEEAYALTHRVMERLDPKFSKILERFAENGQIDVLPYKNKSGGAFCAHFTLKQPTYVLLNFTGNLRDVLTLAHEMGHGINNELVRESQSHDLNFGTPLSTAEVASTFMEDFILNEILATANDELRLAVMVKKLQDDVATIFRQTACYRFETDLHAAFREKGYLSKEEIGKIFQKNMAAYMGDAVSQDPGSENWWIYWGHIRSYFYVYSYSSGLLIGKAMQAGVKQDPGFIQKVKKFLGAGLSISPKDAFLRMGIDITDRNFWEKGLGEVEDLLNETEALAKKLGKIG